MLLLLQIQSEIQRRGLSVVGWYHSHPDFEPRPTYQDVVLQKKYQNTVKTIHMDEPCVGFIISELYMHTLTFLHAHTCACTHTRARARTHECTYTHTHT